MGNGMQARARDIARLAAFFDFPRLLSFYYSTVGGFMSQVFLVMSVFLFMYSRVYLAFDPNVGELSDLLGNLPGVNSQFLLQLGFLLIIPIPLNVSVEKGVSTGIGTLISILLRYIIA
jgi:callose synthase